MRDGGLVVLSRACFRVRGGHLDEGLAGAESGEGKREACGVANTLLNLCEQIEGPQVPHASQGSSAKRRPVSERAMFLEPKRPGPERPQRITSSRCHAFGHVPAKPNLAEPGNRLAVRQNAPTASRPASRAR